MVDCIFAHKTNPDGNDIEMGAELIQITPTSFVVRTGHDMLNLRFRTNGHYDGFNSGYLRIVVLALE